jgi:ferrous iron transport protein B
LSVSSPAAVLRVATVGNPNVGKSSLINALSGANLSVGNWPGTTVERIAVTFPWEGRAVNWVDLPGTYSLAGATSEEAITRDELLRNPPDVVVNVLDAGNLERNLGLTLELCELGLPLVIVLNLVDEAKAHGVEVVETVASTGHGTEQVKAALGRARVPQLPVAYPEFLCLAVERTRQHYSSASFWHAITWLSEDVPNFPAPPDLAPERQKLEQVQDPFLAVAEARLTAARSLTLESERRAEIGATLSERFDRVLLHRGLGLPLFLLGMLLVFRFTYLFSDPWIGYLDVVKTVLSGWVASAGFSPLLQSFLVHGVIDGAGTVAAFSPVLFLLYLAMAFLEGSGLLARTTFLFDQVMKWVGLPGRSLIPLLLGFGCNVPAVYSTRILPHFSDRLRVTLAIPFMACSARLTVFVLFAAVFFPRNGATVVLALYVLGLVLGLLTAWLMRRFVPAESDETGVMELPSYRLPSWRAVLRQAWLRTYSFLRSAGGPILAAVLVVWFLHQVPQGPMDRSLYARVAQTMTVPLGPLGITDWRLAGALMPGFIAKEVVVGTLAVSFLGDEPVQPIGAAAGFGELARGLGVAALDTVKAVPQMVGLPALPGDESPEGLQGALSRAVAPGAAFAYLVFLLLYSPCVATVAATRSEFGTRWAAFSLVWQLSVAWVCAWVAFRLWPA